MDPFVLVNCHQTALVLGGSVPALLPPSIMAVPPIQDDLPQPAAVYQVASLLAPCVHPGTPSLRLQTAVLIHGPSGAPLTSLTISSLYHLCAFFICLLAYQLVNQDTYHSFSVPCWVPGIQSFMNFAVLQLFSVIL